MNYAVQLLKQELTDTEQSIAYMRALYIRNAGTTFGDVRNNNLMRVVSDQERVAQQLRRALRAVEADDEARRAASR